MRNRAKCKLCKDCLESFHQLDYVECGCGEIAIDGGEYEFKSYAKNWENFLRLDENDKEIEVVVKDNPELDISSTPTLTLDDLISQFSELMKTMGELSPQYMNMPITHYDLYSFGMITLSCLRKVSGDLQTYSSNSSCVSESLDQLDKT